MSSYHRVLYFFVAIVFFTATVTASNTSAKRANQARTNSFSRFTKTKESSNYLHNKIIIKLKENQSVPQGAKSFGVSSVDKLLQQYSVTSVNAMFPEKQVTVQQARTDLSNIYIAQYTSPVDAFEMAKEISALDEVEYAEPWFIYSVDAVGVCRPNDSLRADQWALDKIKADSAWCQETGSDTVTIGIIDTGVQWDHPDLFANIWINPGEDGLDGGNNEKRTNGVDDDGNGKVDDFHGWDFGGASYLTPVEDNNPTATSSNVGHGTHVAGIAAASTNNSKGVAGVAYSCKIVPLKAGSDNDFRGSGGTAFIVFGFQALKYAADLGVDVVNCSWGGAGYSQFEQDMVNYATESGTLVVAAAGNSTADEAQYPAAYDGVLSVSARINDTFETKASYSTYHTSVDVSAPGGTGTSKTTSILSTYIGNGYALSTGTSMAAPFVTGLVALTKSRFPELNSYQAGEQVRVTSDSKESQPAYKYKMGKGRINAHRAVDSAGLKSPSIRVTSVILDDAVEGNGNGIPDQGETVYLKCTFENYLLPTTNQAKVTLVSPTTANIQVVAGFDKFTIGNVGTLASTDNYSAPFKIIIGSSVASNLYATLRFDFVDSGLGAVYSDYQWMDLLLNPLFFSHRTNNIGFSVSNFGSLGYYDYTVLPSGASFGDGFQYPIGEPSSLFHSTLMVATDSNHVVDNAFGNPANSNAVDWKLAYDGKFSFGVEEGADQVIHTAFTDSGAGSSRLGLKVYQRSYSYAASADEDYIILRYDVFNKRTDTLKNVYVGVYSDWDVNNININKVGYDAGRNMGYMWDTSGSNYYGIALLNSPAASFRAIHNPTYVYDGFAEGNKHRFMTEGFVVTEGDPVNDWSYILTAGPFTIPPNGYELVGFAFLGGDDLSDLQANTDAAIAKGNTILDVSERIDEFPRSFSLSQNYPNPFNPVTSIRYSIPRSGHVLLKVYDILGHEVATLMNEDQPMGVYEARFNGANLPSGVYYYKLVSGQYSEVKKFILMK